eukprot:34209_1
MPNVDTKTRPRSPLTELVMKATSSKQIVCSSPFYTTPSSLEDPSLQKLPPSCKAYLTALSLRRCSKARPKTKDSGRTKSCSFLPSL